MTLPRWLTGLGFQLLYHQLAWTYDLVAWLVSGGQWSAWRRLALTYAQLGPVLEVAYGTGGLFADMLEAGYKPVGLDTSPHMARLAGKRLRQRKLPLLLTRGKAQSLPFPSEHFATVIATFPTPFIFEAFTLDEIYRVMRSEGQLVVVMEGHLQGARPLRTLINWLYEVTNQRNYQGSRMVQLLEDHQLAAHWQLVEHNGVQARLLVATKQVSLFSE
jgi:ubiquinone/menaquinone biosynthesis C-methylase UbiE